MTVSAATLAAERATFEHAARVCDAFRRAVNPDPARFYDPRDMRWVKSATHSNGLGALGVTLRPSERRAFRIQRARWYAVDRRRGFAYV